MSQSPVWYITGCSSGFGPALALFALRSGHRVIATSRSPSKTPELVAQVEALGGAWHTLDVTSPETDLEKAVEKATAVYGHIDILVNSAAYALLGAFETFRYATFKSFTPSINLNSSNPISDAECRAQMDTNFFGPMSLTRIVLPSMRARKSGTIVQISSTAGLEARVTRSMYSASKFALEAASEALAAEVSPLGIRVLIVSPGAFRSNFSSAIATSQKPLPEEYESTSVGQMMTVSCSSPPFPVSKRTKDY